MPYEKLKLLPGPETCLRAVIALAQLDARARDELFAAVHRAPATAA